MTISQKVTVKWFCSVGNIHGWFTRRFKLVRNVCDYNWVVWKETESTIECHKVRMQSTINYEVLYVSTCPWQSDVFAIIHNTTFVSDCTKCKSLAWWSVWAWVNVWLPTATSEFCMSESIWCKGGRITHQWHGFAIWNRFLYQLLGTVKPVWMHPSVDASNECTLK